MLYIVGLEISESKEIGVKDGFTLSLKFFLFNFHFTTKNNKQINKKQTNKQTNERKIKQATARVDLDLDDS